MVTDPQLLELRQMMGEALGLVRPLAPLAEAVRAHAERVDRALEALDRRLDQAERSHLELKVTLGAMQDRLVAIKEHDARIKSLEDDRIRVRAMAALIGVLVSIGAFIAGKLWK